ncbi:hypothetical protein HYV50_00040 [Candidatus Pacearchaeota archaeon]|nr:hypothetical protein [Candidatus Pacearchaeota archaeon]
MANKKNLFEDLKKQTSRDLLALGSWVFYLLVIIRALIKPYRPFADQLIISALVLLMLSIFIKNSEFYVSRALLLAIFTSLFYQDILFAILAVITFLLLITGSYYLENRTIKTVRGLILGAISFIVGYYLPNLYL